MTHFQMYLPHIKQNLCVTSSLFLDEIPALYISYIYDVSVIFTSNSSNNIHVANFTGICFNLIYIAGFIST